MSLWSALFCTALINYFSTVLLHSVNNHYQPHAACIRPHSACSVSCCLCIDMSLALPSNGKLILQEVHRMVPWQSLYNSIHCWGFQEYFAWGMLWHCIFCSILYSCIPCVTVTQDEGGVQVTLAIRLEIKGNTQMNLHNFKLQLLTSLSGARMWPMVSDGYRLLELKSRR